MRQIIEKNEKREKIFPERAVIVNGHCNEFHKKIMLIELFEQLREYFKDILIFYATHLPIRDKEIYDYVDYIVYNKNNPIFNKDVFTRFSRDIYWWNTWAYKGDKNLRIMKNMLYHGYAHHMLLNDATAIANNQRIEYLHYVNYDVRLDIVHTLEEHYSLMKIGDFDLVTYQYFEDGMGTEFFSAKTSAAVDCICPVISLEDYEKFNAKSLETTYRMMFEGKKIKNLGYFRPDEYNVGRLRFDFRDKFDTVIPLNANIDGVIIIPYEYEGKTRINLSNNNEESVGVLVVQYDCDNEKITDDFCPLGPHQWFEVLPTEKTRYIKVFFDEKEKTYFNLDDKKNFGTYKIFE